VVDAFTFNFDTPLRALQELAAMEGLELGVRRNGDTGYWVDLVAQVGAIEAEVQSQDSMTDDDGTPFSSHVADTGEQYYETAVPYWTIQDNEADPPATSAQKIACQRNGGAEMGVGDEIYAEIKSPPTGGGANARVGFWFMAAVPSNPPVATQDHYVLHVEFASTDQFDVNMGRYATPSSNQYDQNVVNAASWPNSTWRRIGVTIKGLDE
jgi:hypothetical protein